MDQNKYYKCNTCERTFKRNVGYQRHLNRKTPCVKPEPVVHPKGSVESMQQSVEQLTSQLDNFKHWVDTDPSEPVLVEENIAGLAKVQTTIDAIRMIKEYTEDKEEPDWKSEHFLTYQGAETVLRMVDSIYFNPKHPEYHNMYIDTKNATQAHVLVDGQFVKRDVDGVLDIMINTAVDHLEEGSKVKSSVTRYRLKEVREIIATVRNPTTNLTRLKEYLKMHAYNNRFNVIKQFKKFKSSNLNSRL